MLDRIKTVKKERGKTFKVPHADHSEHLDHDSWITRPGDTVIWTSERQFMLHVDYDYAPCDPLQGAPRNPFAWSGVQVAARQPNGSFIVQGTAKEGASLDQMFYKFTAMIEGLEALDPDGICDR
jgi:hypothetical protein